MTKRCQLLICENDYQRLHNHLFKGDGDEHGAIAKAGLVRDGNLVRLLVREVHLARDGIDYCDGKIGYRALQPSFIHHHITRSRDQRLVYLAIHNHGSDLDVGFSHVDLASHERGYPALLDIANGMPVGALVLGKRSVAGDIWLGKKQRVPLGETIVVGNPVRRLYPAVPKTRSAKAQIFDRQIRMFGQDGQQQLGASRVAVIGVGGVGSLAAEYLARLGVGNLILVDPDRIEVSNLSRVVGATKQDAQRHQLKVDVASKHLTECASRLNVETIAQDFSLASVASKLRTCDCLILAADSMRARLVFNAMVHQYFIPGVQLGAKIRPGTDGALLDAMSVCRPVLPGHGCLWCNGLIDPAQLAIEAKNDGVRKAEAYGTLVPNPSVITLNAVAAAHGVNHFLFSILGLATRSLPSYQQYHFLAERSPYVSPRQDVRCHECGREADSRFAMGDARSLPCMAG